MSKEQFLKQHLRPGELYAGLLLSIGGTPDQHIFLLPGEARNITQDDAALWAKSVGGELPNRREQALLFANLKGEFKPRWYWSGEQHEDDNFFAWGQLFSSGGQDYGQKSYGGRARAVRRVPLETA